MSSSWSVLVLALIGMDDQQPSQPKAPNPPISITVDFQSPQGNRMVSSRKDATAIVVEVDDCAEPEKPRKAGLLAKMAGVCAERLAGYVFDEAKAAIIAKIAEATACDPDADERSKAMTLNGGGVRALLLPGFAVTAPESRKAPDEQQPGGAEGVVAVDTPGAIRIALDNSEVVRVISFGAQGIPIGGFYPTPLKAGTPASDSRPEPMPMRS